MNECMCNKKEIKEVTLKPNSNLFLPNIFSPNVDRN